MHKILSIVILILFIASTSQVIAQKKSVKKDWEIEAVPYLWYAGLDGTLTKYDGTAYPFEASFSDVFKNLDFAFMFEVSAKYKKLCFSTDFNYIKLSRENQPAPVGYPYLTTDLQHTETDYEFTAGYTTELKKLELKFMGGAKIVSVSTKLDAYNNSTLFKSGTIEETIVDPIITADAKYGISKGFYGAIHLGYGGFGVNSERIIDSKIMFQKYFSQMFSVRLGYRYLYTKIKKDTYATDISKGGFVMGFGFNF